MRWNSRIVKEMVENPVSKWWKELRMDGPAAHWQMRKTFDGGNAFDLVRLLTAAANPKAEGREAAHAAAVIAHFDELGRQRLRPPATPP